MRKRNVWLQIVAVLMAFPLTSFASGQTKTQKGSGAAGKHPVVIMDTSMGTIKIEVLTDKAPATAKNFLDYVASGFFTGTVFHRVVPDFVIQGGGYLENMTMKPTRAPIRNESKNGLKNLRGTLSMARYDDPNSATSQFFINLKDNAHLDPPPGGWGYAVFARVIEGMTVVDKIAAVATSTRNVQGTPFQNVPVRPVVVQSARIQP